jgi:thymidylate synthase
MTNHLYANHTEQAKLQLTRDPYPLPELVIKRRPETIFDYHYDDFDVINYQSHPRISAPVAV